MSWLIEHAEGTKLHLHQRAVLLLHGLGGSPAEMIYVKLVLERAGFHVDIPLLPGHGTHYSDLKRLKWTDYVDFARDRFQKLSDRYESVSVSGLCLGAVLALDIGAKFKNAVHSISPVSTTLYFDGWGLPKMARFLPFFRYTPVYFLYNLHESEPFGVKDEGIRQWMKSHMTDNSSTHYSKVPFRSVWQMYLLCRDVKARLHEITAPVLAIHPVEDDVSSLQSVETMKAMIQPELFQSLLLKDSYHLATIDKERGFVARSILDFFTQDFQMKVRAEEVG